MRCRQCQNNPSFTTDGERDDSDYAEGYADGRYDAGEVSSSTE